jgi:endogenous inhibitor of DNA gyrase (YacG/DUF329 family)
MDESTPSAALEIRKVNGICPNCGNPSHWSNADHGYMHSNCEETR